MRLQTYLTRNGIGIAEFATAIGVSRVGTIYRYLSGERIPCPRIMDRIRHSTGGVVTADDFFETRRNRHCRENGISVCA